MERTKARKRPTTKNSHRRRHFRLLPVVLVLILCFFLSAGAGDGKEQAVETTVATLPAETQQTETPTQEPTQELTEPVKDYDFSRPVPRSEAVDNSYFDDAVFIGDSRTEGLILYTGLSNAASYTHKGLMVNTVFTEPVVNKNGEKIPVIEALRKTDFKKVYIMFGINETGWPYNQEFKEEYGKLIDEIKSINPRAIIYVQQIIPVTDQLSATHRYVKNGKIREFNKLIRLLAEEKEVYYIDTASAVAMANGSLPEEAAIDGIHLNLKYCKKWLEYLKTHTVSESE